MWAELLDYFDLGAILTVFRICGTVERVVETKEVSKYSKVLEKETWKI